MNNMMLTLNAADVSKLRTMVAAVEKEMALVLGTLTTSETQPRKTALEMTWSNLVGMLDLGPEPEMRVCPECQHLCMMGATRCANCWIQLPAPATKAKAA
ncbi:MAG: hypothetical protein ABSB49_06585 [Polyangia bacterium]|jgi:hypothetical protein